MQDNIVNVKEYIDYSKLQEYIKLLKEKYPFIKIGSAGKSILGRDLTLIKLGTGPTKVFYIGTHHAMEWITTLLLMKFVENYCEDYVNNNRVFKRSITTLFNNNTIYILPMLNPDGVELHFHGLSEDNPLYERLLRLNKGSQDFSNWQANARGVDLNHNYNAKWHLARKKEIEYGITHPGPTRFGGEYPESEPETQSVCDFCRAVEPDITIAFHSQGREIFWDFDGYAPPRAYSIALMMSHLSGYKLSKPEDAASYGGFKDWFITEFNKPGFTIEVGKGKNPLPLTQFNSIYNDLKEILYICGIL